MPSVDKHYDQYKHNKKLLNKLLSERIEYVDWAITITFYAALHLVERKLADLSLHSRTHVERTQKARNSLSTSLLRDYHTLKNQSERARYECVNFSEQDIKDVVNIFASIEQVLV